MNKRGTHGSQRSGKILIDKLPDVVRNPHTIKIIFAKVYGAIDELRAHIFMKDGWFIFKEHTFSKDELLNHPIFANVYAMLGQVDDLVSRWSEKSDHSTLNEDEKDIVKFYHENRVAVEHRLSELRQEILNRKPTFWEQLIYAIELLIKRVFIALPAISRALLEYVGIRISESAKRIEARQDLISDFIRQRKSD